MSTNYLIIVSSNTCHNAIRVCDLVMSLGASPCSIAIHGLDSGVLLCIGQIEGQPQKEQSTYIEILGYSKLADWFDDTLGQTNTTICSTWAKAFEIKSIPPHITSAGTPAVIAAAVASHTQIITL